MEDSLCIMNISSKDQIKEVNKTQQEELDENTPCSQCFPQDI